MYFTSQIFFYLFLIFSLFTNEILPGEIQEVHIGKLELDECLLPEDHPLQDKLKHLFKHSNMFDSRSTLKKAGFDVLDRMHRGLMVASHPTMGNYLIKKFQNEVDQESQLHNFLCRINGATALREFIKLNDLQHIVVPKKWLYELPKKFSDPKTGERTYVLIVEKIDICDGGKDPNGEAAIRYYKMDFDILRELCIVVYYFRGLDSVLSNMPFTYHDKIAFIDTERWDWKRDRYLREAMQYLSQDRQEYALKKFEELREQDKRTR